MEIKNLKISLSGIEFSVIIKQSNKPPQRNLSVLMELYQVNGE